MHFVIKALDADEFSGFFMMDNETLRKNNILRMTVDEYPGYPCRVSLEDALIGEEVILLNYMHHKVRSPYQATGPIFVRKDKPTATFAIDEIPSMLIHRLLSLRAYDQKGMMKNAAVTEGKDLKERMLEMFQDKDILYIHIHNARPGCYNCVAERVI